MENLDLKEEQLEKELLTEDIPIELSDDDSKEKVYVDKIGSAESDLDAEIEKCQNILNQTSEVLVAKTFDCADVADPINKISSNIEITELNVEKCAENLNSLHNTDCDNPEKTRKKDLAELNIVSNLSGTKNLSKKIKCHTDLEIDDNWDYIPCSKKIKLDNNESDCNLEILPSNTEINGNGDSKEIVNLVYLENSKDTLSNDNSNESIKSEDQEFAETGNLQNETIYEVIDSSDVECESIMSGKLDDDDCSREGDTLILCTEESDFESELEKSYKLLDCCEEDLSDDQCLDTNSKSSFNSITSPSLNSTLQYISNGGNSKALTIVDDEDYYLKEESNSCNKNNHFDEVSDIDAEMEKCNEILRSAYSKLEDIRMNNADTSLKAESVHDLPNTLTKNASDFSLKKEITKKLEPSSVNIVNCPDNIYDNTNYNVLKQNKLFEINVKEENSKIVNNNLETDNDLKPLSETVHNIKVENNETNIVCENTVVPSNDKNSETIGKKLNFVVVKNTDDSKDKEIVKDYLEEEKDDIINPEWQAVKNLNTNEERYQKVRQCWKSKSVPDPNKNLTYHSYRKKQFTNSSSDAKVIRQHKRHASNSLPGRNAKRLCTFFLDKEIDSVKRIKRQKRQEIINEMNHKISNINQEVFHFGNAAQSRSYHNFPAYDYFDRNEYHHISLVTEVEDEYNRIAQECEHSFENKLGTLNERRNEVLKFYSFYKGLNDSDKDPTVLTESQFQELDEIENIYKQFDYYYKNDSDS